MKKKEKNQTRIGYCHKGMGERVSAGVRWLRNALPGASPAEAFFQCPRGNQEGSRTSQGLPRALWQSGGEKSPARAQRAVLPLTPLG